jgi:hypothetical protein
VRTTHALLQEIHPAFDVVVRPVPHAGVEVVYIGTIIDHTRVEERLLGPLIRQGRQKARDVTTWLQNTLELGRIQIENDRSSVVRALLDSKAVLCLERGYVVVDVQGLNRRFPEEPQAELSVRGPRDGFTESIETNMSLLRSRLRDPNLVTREFVIGERTRTKTLVLYIGGLADDDVVEEVIRRISRIRVDGVLDSGLVEQWIEDTPWSPYPQLQSTERPDKTVSALLEGRVVVLVDGTPFALLAPTVMISFFQTADDYGQRWISGSVIRLIRFCALALSIFGPSVYIAFTMYNPELIPLNLLLQLAASREGIPFPIVLEAIFMEFMVELVREAANRMPQQVGQSFTVVSGVIIGDIAVTAGIVSPIMVIVVGVTALGAFAIPNYEAAFVTRMIRFPMLLFTSIFGIVGTLWFTLVVAAHLCTLKSFGVPYLTPFVQGVSLEWKDTFVHTPPATQTTRPATYSSPYGWFARGRRRRGERRFRPS